MGWIRGAMIESFLVALGAAGLLLGFILICLARRGRRIDDHPLCRKCGYDLTGRAEGSDRCAECGADLLRRRAIRVGNRVPRQRLVVAGYSFLLMLLMLAGGLVWVQISSADLMKYKPAWLLRSDASSLLSNKRVPAVAELSRRFMAGELSDAQIQAIVSDALVFQTNSKFPWTEWDALVNKILLAGKISDADWVTFVRQAVRLKVEMRPRNRAGDPMPVRLILTTERLPWKTQTLAGMVAGVLGPPPPFIEFEWRTAEISGAKLMHIAPLAGQFPSVRVYSSIDTLRVDESETAGLTEGLHRLSGQVLVTVFSMKSGEKLASFKRTVDAGVTILPANTEPKALFVSNPAVNYSMLNASWNVSVTSLKDWAAPDTYLLSISVANAPAGLAHQGSLRTEDGREFALGVVELMSGPNLTSVGRGTQADNGKSEKVDLILRPDFEFLKKSTRTDPIWGEEIIFRDVNVIRQRFPTVIGSSTRPSINPRPGE